MRRTGYPANETLARGGVEGFLASIQEREMENVAGDCW